MGHKASTVVDPHADDLERYQEFATLKGTKVTHVIDTHIQADHRSGGRELAVRTGAAYCLHEAADVTFPFTPLADDQELVCGNVVIRVLHACQDARAASAARPGARSGRICSRRRPATQLLLCSGWTAR